MSVREQLIRTLGEFSEDVDEVLELLPSREGVAILLVGSINEGFENSESDIDFLAIHSEESLTSELNDILTQERSAALGTKSGSTIVPARDHTTVINMLKSGHALHVEHRTEKNIAELLLNIRERAATYKARTSSASTELKRKGISLVDAERHCVYQFLTGTAIDNIKLVNKLRAQLTLDEFSDYMIHQKMIMVVHHVQDILGLYNRSPHGDEETKAYLFSQLLLCLASISLSAIQKPIVREKFYFRLLHSHKEKFGADFLNQYFSIYRSFFSSGIRNPNQVLSFTKESLELISTKSRALDAELKYRKTEPVGTKNPWPFNYSVALI